MLKSKRMREWRWLYPVCWEIIKSEVSEKEEEEKKDTDNICWHTKGKAKRRVLNQGN